MADSIKHNQFVNLMLKITEAIYVHPRKPYQSARQTTDTR